MKLTKKIVDNNILKYRVYYNWTQEEVAAKLKLSTGIYRQIENDKRYPRADIVRKILNLFDVSLDQMFVIETKLYVNYESIAIPKERPNGNMQRNYYLASMSKK